MVFPFSFVEKEVKLMPHYSYDGPVMEFGKCIMNRWKSGTYAPSEAKARNNLAYQFKKAHNRNATANISLPGNLILTGGNHGELYTKLP